MPESLRNCCAAAPSKDQASPAVILVVNITYNWYGYVTDNDVEGSTDNDKHDIKIKFIII